MKCKKCGMEFEGKLCPTCEESTDEKKPKQRKIYKRPWFVVLVVIIVIATIVVCIQKSGSDGKKIDWSQMQLGDKLPEPSLDRGEIWSNDEQELNVDLKNATDDDYTEYVSECKKMGYTVDEDKDSYSYEAYDKEGYKLGITHIGDSLSIKLSVPEKFETITWPTGTAGEMLPAPKSLQGKFNYEHDKEFSVDIGNTTREDFIEYTKQIQDAGFNVDYEKGDDYYRADNSDGYRVSVEYKGNNTMLVYIKSSGESDDETAIENESDTTEETEDDIEENSTSDSKEEKLGDKFKKAMDSYEDFMDEYCSFMEKYQEDPSDASLLEDYASYMSKYSDMVKKFDKWESKDLNEKEMEYYIDVQARVTKKLAKVSAE